MNKEKRKRLHSYVNEKERTVRLYTLGEEITNAVTHGLGALFGLFIVVYGAIVSNTKSKAFSIGVFGTVLFFGYAISCIYHALKITQGKRVMRVLDHCSIYFIIAATYTPFCLIALSGWVGNTILAINWVACFVGATLTAVNREKFKKFAMTCYLIMGWLALIAFNPLIKFMGTKAFLFMLFGGLSYTIGAVVFSFAKKKRYGHSIWHFFTLAGSFFQFISIILII